jgi:hypothetical protein
MVHHRVETQVNTTAISCTHYKLTSTIYIPIKAEEIGNEDGDDSWNINSEDDDQLLVQYGDEDEDDSWNINSEDDDQPLVQEWGSEHPSPKDTKRAKWSPNELKVLTQLYEKIHTLYPDAEERKHKICLDMIRADPDLRPVFHARHVLDTTRLRDGERRILNKKNKVIL